MYVYTYIDKHVQIYTYIYICKRACRVYIPNRRTLKQSDALDFRLLQNAAWLSCSPGARLQTERASCPGSVPNEP